MSLLSWFRKTPPAPHWCSFFTRTEYAEFIKLVESYFAQKNIDVELSDGQALLKEDKQTLGLGGLSENCKRTLGKDWQTIINNHFDSILSIDSKELEKSNNFEDIRESIIIRFFAIDSPYVKIEDAIFREPIPGIASALMIDYPTFFTSVLERQRRAWPIDDDALFSLAKKNMRQRTAFEVNNVEMGSWTLRALSGESFLVGGLALYLDELPGCMGEKGALVSIPSHHTVLCLALECEPEHEQIAALSELTQNLFGKLPGPISPDVFHFQNSHFERLT
jgi:hypothetical protein